MKEDAMTSLDDAVAFIQRGNCMDCFHPECLKRSDLARALVDLEREDPLP
ncbi:hypothetical protein GCM10009651_36560 [Microbacterium natoriense]